MRTPALLTALLALAFASAASANTVSRFDRVRRAPANATTDLVLTEQPTSHLAKRGYSGRATYFEPGLGACGGTNTASDFIVALNVAQYGNTGVQSSWCFQMITITYGGKSTQAQIVDACPGCPYGGLDMSPGLFKYFASESVGVFYMNWSPAGAAAPSPTSTYTPPPPTSTYTPPPPTSTYTPPPPTSTYTPPPPPTTTYTPTSTSTTSSKPSLLPTVSLNATIIASNLTSSANTTTSASTTSVKPEATPAATPLGSEMIGGNLDRISQLVLGLGGLVGAAAAGAGSQ